MHKWKVKIAIAFSILIFLSLMVWGVYKGVGEIYKSISQILEQSIVNKDNLDYLDYICKDYHLVCLESGGSKGKYEQKNEGGESGIEYDYYYTLVKDVPDDKLIAVGREAQVISPSIKKYVLQHPDYQVDILNEWKIKAVQVYYYLPIEIPSGYGHSRLDAPAYVLASSSQPGLINEILNLSLNSEPKEGNYYIEKEYMDYKLKDETLEKPLYLRVLFHESDSIAWDTPIEIMHSTVDEDFFLVMMYQGTIDDEYEIVSRELILDPSSEFYKFIMDAYLNGYPKD